MNKPQQYIGGDFSWQSLSPYISLESSDFDNFFPPYVNEKIIDFYQTGVDALCGIIIESVIKESSKSKVNIWFPEHYCFSSIRRVKSVLAHTDIACEVVIRSYISLSEAKEKSKQKDCIIVLHLNIWTKKYESDIKQLKSKGLRVIEDFVLCPLDIKEFQGDFAFNSLRKLVPLDIAVAYKKIKHSVNLYDYRYESIRKSAMHLKSLVEQACELGYEEEYLKLFREAEQALLSRYDIISASPENIKIAKSIIFSHIKKNRKQNFTFLEKHLVLMEDVTLLEGEYMYCMILHPDRDRLKKYLFANNIFPAIHWSDSPSDKSKCILSLPIDQRYITSSMERLIATLKEF